ncbi:MAG TPA: translation initiation factor IF-2, partial [Alphaproteobacteria bacterium]|nr:translation initiation factor IF-2 [Alphaproteobacteria bacterium]
VEAPVDEPRAAPVKSEEARRAEEADKSQQAENFRQLPGGAAMPTFRKPVGGDGEESESMRDRLKKAAGAKQVRSSTEDRRRSRITVTQALNSDSERDRGPSLAAQRRAREKARLAARGPQVPQEKVFREVIIPETLTVGELAVRMTEQGKDVIKALMKLGVMATINQSIDADTAELVVSEFGHSFKRVTDADVEIGVEGVEDRAEELITRAPVVTIMGHVDHGKTSLLDALRSTDVVSGEAGGITQHIGAYQVTMPSGQKITFLDTPGHAAFTEMRARGANATDIVVIVVAANDSIMPQTVEAINHARAANVPIIIAINKIDLPDANPAKVKQDLLQHSVVIEELSGDVQCVEISAKKKLNLDKLEEAILIQAEVLELKANPNREAQGVVVESKLDKGRGAVATVLVQKGTLKIGDIFIAGSAYGRVRAIVNDHGKNITEAGPGLPVEVLGGNGAPMAGDVFSVVDDEARAREITDYRIRKQRSLAAAKAVKGRATLEDILLQKELGEITKLPVIIKADVHGSVEAITASLKKLSE